MRMQEVEFWSLFDDGSGIFICFANDERCICNVYRLGKSCQSCSYQVVKSGTCLLQYVHDHGGGGGFTMAAADCYTFLLQAFLVDIFREGVDLQLQLLCPD